MISTTLDKYNIYSRCLNETVCTLQHVAVGGIGDREQVRGHLQFPLAPVLLNDLLRVDGQSLVRVDHDAEQTRVRLQYLFIRCHFMSIFTTESI